MTGDTEPQTASEVSNARGGPSTEKRIRWLPIVLVAAVVLVVGVVARPNVPSLAGASDAVTGNPDLAGAVLAAAGDGAYDQLSAAIVTPDDAIFAGIGADESTEFEVGSITKTMTGLLLAQSDANDTLALDDEAREYLDLGEQTFTLGDLASHQSGLSPMQPGFVNAVRAFDATIRLTDPYRSTVDEVIADARGAELSGVGEYSYSNFGFGLLGQAIAAAEGTSYDDLVRDRIFAPLGMESSRVPVAASDVADDAPRGYGANGRQSDSWTLNALAPAGSVRSTASDLAKYARAHMVSDPVLGVDIATLVDPRVEFDGGQTVGLGWHTRNEDGRTLHWHNGGTGGFSSMLVVDPAAQVAVIVLGNTVERVDDIALSVLDAWEARS